MDKFLIKKYIAIVSCLLGCFAIIGFAAVASHNFTLAGQAINFATPGEIGPINNGTGSYDTLGNSQENQPAGPKHPDINVLVLGLDEGSLPDTMFLLMFDGATSMIDVINIPRDTRVNLTQTERDMYAEINRWFPAHGDFKLNEMASYAGINNGYRFVTHHLENMLDVEIDHHIIIGLDAFKYAVDAVGGIYMDIPEPGLFYRGRQLEDGTWDAGTIDVNIPAGRQFLDGRRAEQVIRFRQFRTGDIGRIDMQQEFMREFFVQVLSDDDLNRNLPGLAASLFGRIRTDLGLSNIFNYLVIVEDLDLDNIEFHMLAGTSGEARDAAGVNRSWFFPDVGLSRDLIIEIKEDNARLAAEMQ